MSDTFDGPHGLSDIDFFTAPDARKPFETELHRRDYEIRDYVCVLGYDGKLLCDAFVTGRENLDAAAQYLLDLCNVRWPD